MKQYTIVYACRCGIHPTARTPIVLIGRKKKDWQQHKINLPGGSLEEGEDPVAGGIRELREETGLHADPKRSFKVGEIRGATYVVHVIVAKYPSFRDGQFQQPKCIEFEEGAIFKQVWGDLRDRPELISNLKLIIPLCRAEVRGWVLYDLDTITTESNAWKFSFEPEYANAT